MIWSLLRIYCSVWHCWLVDRKDIVVPVQITDRDLTSHWSKSVNKKLSCCWQTRAMLCISWNDGLLLLNNAIRSPVSLRSTFSNSHVLLSYLHSFEHPCSRLHYCTASMQCHACHQQTFVQLTLLMSTWPWLWSTNFDYHQCCWEHPVFLRQCTVMDVDHHGGRTQIFGGKASERLFDLSKNATFTYLTCIWRPWSFASWT